MKMKNKVRQSLLVGCVGAALLLCSPGYAGVILSDSFSEANGALVGRGFDVGSGSWVSRVNAGNWTINGGRAANSGSGDNSIVSAPITIPAAEADWPISITVDIQNTTSVWKYIGIGFDATLGTTWQTAAIWGTGSNGANPGGNPWFWVNNTEGTSLKGGPGDQNTIGNKAGVDGVTHTVRMIYYPTTHLAELYVTDMVTPVISGTVANPPSALNHVVFHSQAASGFIDNLVVETIPEPTAMSLIAAGLLAALWARWRRRG